MVDLQCDDSVGCTVWAKRGGCVPRGRRVGGVCADTVSCRVLALSFLNWVVEAGAALPMSLSLIQAFL